MQNAACAHPAALSQMRARIEWRAERWQNNALLKTTTMSSPRVRLKVMGTRHISLKRCRRESEKTANAPRYLGRKPGPKSFDLHLLEQAYRASVRRVRLLQPRAWKKWPLWLRTEDIAQRPHVLSALFDRYMHLRARLLKRPAKILEVRWWRRSNTTCRTLSKELQRRVWRGLRHIC